MSRPAHRLALAVVLVVPLLLGAALLLPLPAKTVTSVNESLQARSPPVALVSVALGLGPLNPAATAARPGVQGGLGKLLVTTTDPAIVPNDGLRVNITEYSAAGLPPSSSFQVGAEQQIGVYEAVMGIFTNTATFPVPFFSVFVLKNDSNVHLAYWPTLALVPGDSYEFFLQHASGTVWAVTVNGQLFGQNLSAASFDFGASTSTRAANTSFAETALFGSSTTTPLRLDIPLAFAFHRTSGWYLPQNAAASFNGTPGAQWGVEGRIQHPSLAPGELDTGTGIANVTNGTTLWTGGPVPVRVVLGLPVSSALATSTVRPTVETTDLSGGPISGAPVFLNDSLGGTMNPPTIVTNSTGGAAAFLQTPNASRIETDNLSAVVTLFGYRGAGTAPLTLIPPVQVRITANPSSPSVPPSQSLEVTFRATYPNGTGAAYLEIAFSTVGGGVLSPTFVLTDPGGNAAVIFIAPSVVAQYPLNATVASNGYWGHVAVVIHVGSGTPSFWDRYGGALTLAIVVIALAVVTAAVILYFRRRRKAMPNLPIRRYLLEMRRPTTPVTPVPPSGPPPVNRTPPSGGSP